MDSVWCGTFMQLWDWNVFVPFNISLLSSRHHQPSWTYRFMNSWWRLSKQSTFGEKQQKTKLPPAFIEGLSVCIWFIQMESDMSTLISHIRFILMLSTYQKWSHMSVRTTDNVGINCVSTVQPVEHRYMEVSLFLNSLLSKMCHNFMFQNKCFKCLVCNPHNRQSCILNHIY